MRVNGTGTSLSGPQNPNGATSMEVFRRGVLGGVVGAGGALLAQVPAANADGTASPAPAAAGANRMFAIDLHGQPDVLAMNGSWLKEVNFKNFPISQGISGALISLGAGALRELHWHAQAAEWAYVISGHCRVSIIDPHGQFQTVDFAPGDTWYFPRGYGHAIQCLGDSECLMLLAFDSGIYSEFATFSLSDWVVHTPKPILAQTFGVPDTTFDGLPNKSEFFAKAQSPGPLPLDPVPGSLNEGPLSCRYPLRAQRPTVTMPNGSMRIASSKEFPISTSMTAAYVHLEPGGLPNPHWHPDANEWQYVVSGTARTTIFLSHEQVVACELPAGHVAYVPRGCGHFTESVGSTPLELVAVFDNDVYATIEMKDWVRSNIAELVAADFRLSPQVTAQLVR